MKKTWFFILSATICLMLSSLACFGQATKVKGRVTDVRTGEGIPFVGVFFKGTTIGVTTDMDGYYSLETRDTSARILRAELLGYDPQEKPVNYKGFSSVDFALAETENRLAAVTVRPDNRRIRKILKGIDDNRSKNDPERRDSYKCDIYNKIEIDLTNAEQTITNKKFRKNFGFVFDYIDTSAVSGQPYLPVMISETVGRKFHSKDPSLDKEIIKGSRISGIDAENHLTQFTGSLKMKANMYDSFIKAFDVEVPSPLSPSGSFYYDYYLIDSTSIEGRKTYYIRYHPKKMISTPVFDGEMRIDARDYALLSFHGKLSKASNINWIRDFVLDIENQFVDDTWFHKMDKMYVDFSVTKNDSIPLMSFLGNRQIYYSNPVSAPPTSEEIEMARKTTTVMEGAGNKDEAFWDSNRPYELSERERQIYHMVDTVKTIPLYKDMYTVVSTIVQGYYDIGKVSLGPVFSTLSFNNLMGLKLRLGARTSSQFSKKVRFGGYFGYGFLDQSLVGGGTFEYMFSKDPTSKLKIEFKHDVAQLGVSKEDFADDNLLASVMTKANSERKSMVDKFEIRWDKEWSNVLNCYYEIESRRIHSNMNVPMFLPDGTGISGITDTKLHFNARMSWDETVTRGNFKKTYVYTKYPILTLNISGAHKGILSDYTYLRTEAQINYRLPIPPLGVSHIKINGGKIFGQVPYPLLKLHEGNGTYIYSHSSFTCMNFYEFASDTWATVNIEHNFHGFFLGMIPLIRKMQLREVVTMKAAWGTLSDKNKAIPGITEPPANMILFPKGMSSLEKPYVELGVGITNILRLLRVDWTWRMTHRYITLEDGSKALSDNLFAITIGLDVRF